MTPADYVERDASALAALVQEGEVTCAELLEAAIERIEALNGRLNAVVERDYEGARAAALRTERSAALAGVPFLAKDMNIDVARLHLTASCRWLSGLPAATTDAPLAARWRKAGLSILGRTNTPEFAGEFVCEPTWRGSTQNPWDMTFKSRRLERWRRGGGGKRHGADRPRHRFRRFDPRARSGLRARGAQAEPRLGAGRTAS